MTTIEITDIADVQDGDIVTLRWEREAGVTVTLEGPAQDSRVSGYMVTDARFVSATREVPEWEPGTVYEITTPDGDTVRAWCLKHVPGGSAFVTRDGDEFTAEELASIQPAPDNTEALGKAYDDLTERWKAQNADIKRLTWNLEAEQRGRDALAAGLEAERDKVLAEVERLRAARTVPTRAQVQDALGQVIPYDSYARVLALIEQGGAS